MDLLGRIQDIKLDKASVLNLGAGICGSPISEQLHFLPCNKIIHVEKFEPYMSQLRAMSFAAREVEFHEVDIIEYLSQPRLEKPDISLMIDVLEHLPKEDAIQVLDTLLKITGQRILIWLPLGECPIEPIHDNPYQVHLSTWFPDDELFRGHTVETFPRFHAHLDPPADAGWVIINTKKPSTLGRLKNL